jgi:monoamine oxidase
MILIIGAGLSGLLTAYRLQKAGIAFKILEARPRVGGRINTIQGSSPTPVEMGATWFNEVHHNLMHLLNELELNSFEQYMEGAVFFQPHSVAPVQSISIPSQSPSYRIAAGSSRLIAALHAKLNPEDVLLNQAVTHISFGENKVKAIANATFEGTQLVLALPPKLWAKKIFFEPNLPEELLTMAKENHTWMEDSIKVALTYEVPFWQQEKQSGALFSQSGPMTELYDHCNMERSTFALCGFMSSSFAALNSADRQQAVVHQLQNVFGSKAAEFTEYHECIWSDEEHTFTPADTFLFPHQNNGHPLFSETFFDEKLIISSAETAVEFAGYMDGAVSAGNRAAEIIIKAKKNL